MFFILFQKNVKLLTESKIERERAAQQIRELDLKNYNLADELYRVQKLLGKL